MQFRCIQLEDSEKVSYVVHLACLLIPPLSLATLCYLLQFFEAVALQSSANLMDATNLSIVMAPTLMPFHLQQQPGRNDKQNCTKLHNYVKIVQVCLLVIMTLVNCEQLISF